MDNSIFLAKAMGVYFLIVAIGLFFNRDRFLPIVTSIMNNEGLQLILGLFLLIIGLLIVLSHNIWEASWIGLITLVGWLIFIKGILNVVFPRMINSSAQPLIRTTSIIYASILIYLLLGIIFAYYGFFYNPY